MKAWRWGFAFCLAALVGSDVRAEGKTVRVMAVGNSFSRNAFQFLDKVAAAAGDTVIATNAMIGGCEFARHVRHLEAFEADPSSTEGRPYPGGKSLKDLLTAQPWDVVTIQQVSRKSFLHETFQPHVDRLVAYIREHAPQAEIVIHQTWAYRDDHGFKDLPLDNPDTMYKGLRAAYDKLAEETGFRLIPCGDAFEAARRDAAWGPFVGDPAFDPTTAKHPALPVEKRALHSGYFWKQDAKTGEYKLGKDAFHANREGAYLLGCVWYEFLFARSVVGNAFLPQGMAAEDAAILQKVAHRVVTEKQRPPVD